MKTSVIEVSDMLSVLSVDEVEKRIGKVPGVESVTVNYAAGSATVRYDEPFNALITRRNSPARTEAAMSVFRAETAGPHVTLLLPGIRVLDRPGKLPERRRDGR